MEFYDKKILGNDKIKMLKVNIRDFILLFW